MKKRNVIILVIVIVSLIIIVFFYLKRENQQALRGNINLPVYSAGFDVSTNMKGSAWDEEVFYKVKINFPAAEVISFYDKAFQARGFLSYAEDGHGTRTWENFNIRTGNWESTSDVPARYIATWVDKEKATRIVLFIRYAYDYENKDWDRILLINCSKGKFFKLGQRQKP
jgi:hypothetical protein